MATRSKKFWAAVVGMSLLVMAGPVGAQAEESLAPPVRVGVEETPVKGCDALMELFVREATVRTTAALEMVERGGMSDGMRDRKAADWMVWAEPREEGCVLVMDGEGAAEELRFEVDQGADRLEVAAVITRMIWMIEATEVEDAEEVEALGEVEALEEQEEIVELDGEQGVLGFEIGVIGEGLGDLGGVGEGELVEASSDRRRENFEVDVLSGPLMMSGADGPMWAMKALGSWSFWGPLGVYGGVRGPLSMGRSMVGTREISYRPWAVDAGLMMSTRGPGRWGFQGGAGVRWSWSALAMTAGEAEERDGPTGPDREMPQTSQSSDERSSQGEENRRIPTLGGGLEKKEGEGEEGISEGRLTSLGLMVQGGAGYRVWSNVSLRLDVAAGWSLTDRRIYEEGEAVFDLGRLEGEVLFGLAARF